MNWSNPYFVMNDAAYFVTGKAKAAVLVDGVWCSVFDGVPLINEWAVAAMCKAAGMPVPEWASRAE